MLFGIIPGITLYFVFSAVNTPAFTQSEDSVKTYNLEQITIEADTRIETRNTEKISLTEIELSDARSVAEFGKLIPSVKVQTNSRGETLFFLRGAGERQVMLFFDGVPLNIPWDNRIDLSLVPSEAVAEITVNKGISSVLYGANAVSGVVNIRSKSLPNGEYYGKASGLFGENSNYFSGILLKGGETISFLLSSSYKNSDGFNLPGSFSDSANEQNLRINSGIASFDLFGKLDYKFSEYTRLDLSASFIDSEKEVPPEINVSNPRYWRYPLWRRLNLNLSGNHVFNENSRISFLFSGSDYQSRIDQYSDISFSEIGDVEKSRDFVGSGRIIWSTLFGRSSLLKIALNGLSSVHSEEVLSEGNSEKKYVKNVLSAGAEHEYFTGRFTFITGIGFDHSSAPETGIFPPDDPLSDYSFTAGLTYSLNSSNTLFISGGRKTRFPTLRESYSGALGRFIPNPGLKAEAAYSLDAGLNTLYNYGKLDLTFFVSYLNDAIVRESLEGGRFRRVNEDVVRTFGIEVNSNHRLNDDISALFRFTWLKAAAEDEESNFKDTLEYKPQFISSLSLYYNFSRDIESLLEINYTAEEFGLQEGNAYFRKLPENFIVNLRLTYNLSILDKLKLDIFGRINNLFDKLYYGQWGLPEAGRNFTGGISVEI